MQGASTPTRFDVEIYTEIDNCIGKNISGLVPDSRCRRSSTFREFRPPSRNSLWSTRRVAGRRSDNKGDGGVWSSARATYFGHHG